MGQSPSITILPLGKQLRQERRVPFRRRGFAKRGKKQRKQNTMNICALAGRLVRNAVVKGTEKKVLLFTLATKCGYDETEQKDRITNVPCVVFNPTAELEAVLVNDGKGTYIQPEGRVSTSSYEVNDERKFTTEVVVFNRSLTVLQK